MAKVQSKTTTSYSGISTDALELACRFYSNAEDPNGPVYTCTRIVGPLFSPTMQKLLVSHNPKGYTQVQYGKARMNWKDRDGNNHIGDIKFAKWAFDENRFWELKNEALIYEEMRMKGDIVGKIVPEFYGYYEAKDRGTGKVKFAVSVFDFHQDSPEKKDQLVGRAPAAKQIVEKLIRYCQTLHDKGILHKRLFFKSRDDKQVAIGISLWADHVRIDDHGDVRLVSFEAAKKHEVKRHPQSSKRGCPEVVLMQLYRHSKSPADFLGLVGEDAADQYFSS